MGGVLSNSTNVTQTLMNSVFEETATACNATCTATQNGNVVIINDTTIDGSAGFQESCSVAASCVMNNTLDSQVQNIVSSLLNQSNTAATDFLGDLSFNGSTNSANLNQNVSNYITQIIDSTCNAQLAFTQDDNLLYVSNSNVTGFVGFQIGTANQPNSANASCAMSNLSKSVVYNNVQAQVSQSNVQIGIFALIVAAIIAIVLIGAIVTVVLASTGTLKAGIDSISKGPLGNLTPEQSGQLLDVVSKNPELVAAAL